MTHLVVNNAEKSADLYKGRMAQKYGVLKGYTASKSSRLYSFQPRHVLLPYLSVTMHFTQYQRGTISFTDYYVVACCT